MSKLAAESGSRRSMLIVRQFMVEAMVWGSWRCFLVFEIDGESDVRDYEGYSPLRSSSG